MGDFNTKCVFDIENVFTALIDIMSENEKFLERIVRYYYHLEITQVKHKISIADNQNAKSPDNIDIMTDSIG